MVAILFTIGFAKKTAEQFFRLLRESGVERVIDIRENRIGQLSGFAKYPDIAFFLERLLGIGYVYEPLLAPSPEIRRAYRKTRDWEQYETSYRELMHQRNIPEKMDLAKFEGRVALLCSEAEPDKCHRRLVADMLARHGSTMGREFDVRHLVITSPRPVRKSRKARRDDGTHPI